VWFSGRMTQMPSDFAATRSADALATPWFGTFDTDFATPQLKLAFDVWDAKRGTRSMPARLDLGIRDLKFALPNLSLLDIVREGHGLRYRVRLVGSILDEMVAPMTGRFLDEAVPGHFAQKWSTQWLPAIVERRVMRGVGRVEFAGRRWYVAESAFCPLASDGETPDILMVLAYYHGLDGGDAASRDVATRLVAELEQRGSKAT
jgi:hypothetical protein